MKARLRVLSAAGVAIVVSMLALQTAAETTIAKPEDVGLSTERLARITEMMKRHIAAGEISGGVTLVARHGRIAHFEAVGVMDADSKQPMTKDAVFRIASMTKPVTGLAVMMMMEEGKLRIADPVSKYIPQFKEMNVAMALPKQGPPPGAAGGDEPPAPPRFYTVPAEREITTRCATCDLSSRTL
jgi:CubicO group peptidase (beta-lactamase class C family)